MKSAAMLTLMGKVEDKIISTFYKSKSSDKDNAWFFIDYSGDEIKVGEIFDTLLEGRQRTLIPGETRIKLKKVYDQLGNKLGFIPEGFQTICQFEFDEIPMPITKLPVLETWVFNPNSISIANHELIQLSEPDVILRSMNTLFIIEIQKHFHSHKSTVTRQELKDFFKEKYLLHDVKRISSLLNMWKVMGLVREKKNNELELVTENK